MYLRAFQWVFYGFMHLYVDVHIWRTIMQLYVDKGWWGNIVSAVRLVSTKLCISVYSPHLCVRLTKGICYIAYKYYIIYICILLARLYIYLHKRRPDFWQLRTRFSMQIGSLINTFWTTTSRVIENGLCFNALVRNINHFGRNWVLTSDKNCVYFLVISTMFANAAYTCFALSLNIFSLC